MYPHRCIFACLVQKPSPRLSWQHARAHETSWEYVHISNMTLDDVGEQAFHWVLSQNASA
jgi:hypothetical protein